MDRNRTDFMLQLRFTLDQIFVVSLFQNYFQRTMSVPVSIINPFRRFQINFHTKAFSESFAPFFVIQYEYTEKWALTNLISKWTSHSLNIRFRDPCKSFITVEPSVQRLHCHLKQNRDGFSSHRSHEHTKL